MIAGLILGLLLSVGAALLLPLIFPAEKKPNVPREMQHVEKTARVLQARIERASKAVEIGGAGGAITDVGGTSGTIAVGIGGTIVRGDEPTHGAVTH
jgi:hypothetical protein